MRKQSVTLLSKWVVYVCTMFVLLSGLLFLSGGSFAFWGAWFAIGAVIVPMLVLGVYLFCKNPKLLAERMNHREQQREQQNITNTGGIVIAAKNAETLRILNQKMKDRELHKFYLCVVHGELEQKSGTLSGYLVKDESKNKVTVSKNARQGAKEIRTKYKVLDCDGTLSLVEVELLTGRTHQIRAHFASIGHPLLGDGKYGTNAQNKKYGYKKQFLYSYKLVFDFTTDAGILDYLNHKEFEVKDVWFKEEFYNKGI